MVKVQVNSQGKVLTTGGKALVAFDGSKYGATVNSLLGNVDANGILQQPTEQYDLVFTGIKVVGNYVFYHKFIYTKVKSASFPALTTISGNYGCQYMFYNCTALTSVSYPALTTISGSYGCSYMFYNCTALTSASFPALTTISGGYGCHNMFTGCAALKTASFPALTTISGSSGCNFMFRSCTTLSDVYFPALTTTSFGTSKNQFTNMMNSTGSTTTHTLHFPSNLESTISTLTGYPLFGGTSGYVVCAFDLPATE